MTTRPHPAPLLHAASRSAWRAWLRKHSETAHEVWLVYPKKHTGKPRIAYNDAVEEALCFGWIDSTVRSVDEDSYAQRFTPRNPKAPYSQANKERLKLLIAQGKVAKKVVAAVGDLDEGRFEVAADILAAIRANPVAWKNFRRFSPAYVRIRIGFVEGARRRPAEFQKRLRYFIAMTEKNKQFGFGGVEKYF